MWNELSTSIGAKTDYSSVKYTQIGSDAFYELTYSVTGPARGDIDLVSPNSFRAPLWHEGAHDIDEVSHLVDHAGVYRTLHDNAFVNTPIPRSDFQYSWIQKACGTGRDTDFAEQIITGYAPVDGLASGSSGIQEAIVFPGSSGDLDCIGCWNGVYAFGSLHQTYECGGGEIDLGTLITFDHPLGIDSPDPIANVRGYPSGVPWGNTGSYLIDYTASYGGGAGVLYRTVEFVIQDTIPPVLAVTNRKIWGDAAYAPQVDAPMNNATSWWAGSPNPNAARPIGIPGTYNLEASDVCGTVTWTSGAFGTIPITGSGYVPDTYVVSFTASDSNGLSSDDEFNLVIELQTPLESHWLHDGAAGFPAEAPAPFVDYGPSWVIQKTSSPTLITSNIPAADHHGPRLYYNNLKLHVEIDANGHAWYPIPSASWWDPAAHTDPSDAPASNKVIGMDQNHGEWYEIDDGAGYLPATPFDNPAASCNVAPGGECIGSANYRPGYILLGIAGLFGGTPHTASVWYRTGTVTWSKTIRGQIYSLTSSYEIGS